MDAFKLSNQDEVTIKVEDLLDDDDGVAHEEKFPISHENETPNTNITVFPLPLYAGAEEDKLHVINDDSLEYGDTYEYEDGETSSYEEVMEISDVELTDDISPNIKEEQLDQDSVTVKVGGNVRKGIKELGPSYNSIDDLFEPKNRLIKIDKADPRSRLHFIKYMKKSGKAVQIWECGICGKEFMHQYTLKRHLPAHTDERNFKCEHCGKAFRQLSTLTQHYTTHSKFRPYVCDICRKTFSRVSTLISHKKTHSEKKSHKCTLCGKSFHQKGNLKNHMHTHTNARPYKCNICGRGFNQSSNLLCHKSKVHVPCSANKLQINERFKCNYCNMAFARRAQLRQHEEYHHMMKEPTSLRRATKPNIILKRNSFPHKKKIGNIQIIQMPHREKEIIESRRGLLIDPVDTKAMHLALSNGLTPFALLNPFKGSPVVVKVLLAPNSKHMLVPASATDLKSAGKFQVTNDADGNKSVQTSIPVVAIITQKVDDSGEVHLEVHPPLDEGTEGIGASKNNTLLSDDVAKTSKTSATKSNIAVTQHFVLNPNVVENVKDSSIDEDTLPTLTTAVELGISEPHEDLFQNRIDLSEHDPVALKDNILDIEGAAQYLRPTGVIGEYEVIDENVINEESIIEPVKHFFDDSGPVTVDQNHLSALMDVLQTAGYQLQTQSHEELPTPHQVMLKSDTDALIIDDQLDDVSVDAATIRLVVQDVAPTSAPASATMQ